MTRCFLPLKFCTDTSNSLKSELSTLLEVFMFGYFIAGYKMFRCLVFFFFYQIKLETIEEKKQDTYFHTSISAIFFSPVPGELSFTAFTLKPIKKLVKITKL
jgi:hypothetical protein